MSVDLNEIKKKIFPPCEKCPYKLGLIQTLVDPCPKCKLSNYANYDRFIKMNHSAHSESLDKSDIEGEQMTRVKTYKELKEAYKNKTDELEVYGDLSKHIIKIKATGKIAWGVCVVAIVAIVTSAIALPPRANVKAAAGEALLASPVLATTLGASAMPAIIIAITSGGVGILISLRDEYEIVEKKENSIVLKRKNE